MQPERVERDFTLPLLRNFNLKLQAFKRVLDLTYKQEESEGAWQFNPFN